MGLIRIAHQTHIVERTSVPFPFPFNFDCKPAHLDVKTHSPGSMQVFTVAITCPSERDMPCEDIGPIRLGYRRSACPIPRI